ncbi:hypothetical protein A2U01_0077369, partial [Trifolium medium]|nr:hypothetical protein [Trifolium medium]
MDPELDWVGPEPRGIASVLTLDDLKFHMVIERRRRSEPRNWRVFLPGDDDRVCSSYSEQGFAMYEFVFSQLGLRLPFSDLAVEVLQSLRVAP